MGGKGGGCGQADIPQAENADLMKIHACSLCDAGWALVLGRTCVSPGGQRGAMAIAPIIQPP
jgi:hypothetical protein